MADLTTGKTHQQEIARGERFAFGDNWARFLQALDEQRIQQAVDSLKAMLEVENLNGKSFLDIGSGSGLFSLAAKRLGAKVFSFDYDPRSVACTKELKKRYFEHDSDWQVQTGSVLDKDFLNSLGKFDIVYSWGVLHHTGNMWTALANVDANVTDNGKLFIALYNNQGRASKRWWAIKKAYVSLPKFLRWVVLIPCYVILWGPSTLRDIARLRPFKNWRTYKIKNRGMSPHRDVVDWVGGFPFEVASPEQIFDFYKKRDYRLVVLKTCRGAHGCNEFVFQRNSKPTPQQL
jgi:2-polyprenyl-3-methyl-5-hydroxy-6-metoxy-1,4-benzoquinol methylase